MYVKDTNEAKYQFLIRKCESVGKMHCNDHKAFIENSNNTQDVHKNIDDYNSGKGRKTFTVFNDLIDDIFSNKNRIQQQLNYLLEAQK